MNDNAEDLLQKSINYHDPDGQWPALQQTLIFVDTRPDKVDRHVRTLIDLPGERFHYKMTEGDLIVERIIEKGKCRATLNGSTTYGKEEEQKYRLSCDMIAFYRNYMVYLWGLPMKLRDPGTNLDPAVTRKTFQGKDVLALKVTYDEEVGTDVWYFYLDPDTHAMVGYEFVKPNGKGEYITLEGEYQLGKMRLPKARTWYITQNDKLLGTDTLVGHE